MLRTVRDWATSLLFMVVFGLSMLAWDFVLRVASLFGRRANSYVGGGLQVWLLWTLRICDIRLTVERSPLVKPHTSYIIISNHQSMFDMPAHGSTFFSNFPKYIAKVELSKWIPSVSFHLRSGGHAIIDRKDRESAVKAIDKLGREILEHGFSAVIFPEGTRARKGEIGPFKPAGTVALLKQARRTQVVPVCVDNSWRIMEHNLLPVPFGLRIWAWVGDPIERRDDEDPYAVVAEAERQIRAAMARHRGTAAEAPAAGKTAANAAPGAPAPSPEPGVPATGESASPTRGAAPTA